VAGVFGVKEADMPGIHHVTAIAGDPVRNLGFYAHDLGLRFVKKTVNFDDPSTYHFYYGDETGRPGTILTFFPWTNAQAGRRGAGETRQTAFRIPLRSIGYWTERFVERGVPHQALVDISRRFMLLHRSRGRDGSSVFTIAFADAARRWGGGRTFVDCSSAVRPGG
jgi:glyoxalase family protein